MTCDDAIILIHLDRPGERTESEEQTLTAHLRTCDSCRAEALRTLRLVRRMDELAAAPPPPTSVARQTDNILRETRLLTYQRRNLIDTILLLSERREIRVGYALASLCVMAIMLFQVLSMPSPAARTPSERGLYISYTLDARQLSALPLPSPLKERVGEDGTLHLRKEELERSAGIIGQAMIASLSLPERQRTYATALLATLAQTSELSFRLGKAGS